MTKLQQIKLESKVIHISQMTVNNKLPDTCWLVEWFRGHSSIHTTMKLLYIKPG